MSTSIVRQSIAVVLRPTPSLYVARQSIAVVLRPTDFIPARRKSIVINYIEIPYAPL